MQNTDTYVRVSMKQTRGAFLSFVCQTKTRSELERLLRRKSLSIVRSISTFDSGEMIHPTLKQLMILKTKENIEKLIWRIFLYNFPAPAKFRPQHRHRHSRSVDIRCLHLPPTQRFYTELYTVPPPRLTLPHLT